MSSPIAVGDKVEIRGYFRQMEYARIYAEKARKPFVVETSDRTRGRTVVYGGQMLVWRSHLRRVRTKRQLERDLAKAQEAT